MLRARNGTFQPPVARDSHLQLNAPRILPVCMWLSESCLPASFRIARDVGGQCQGCTMMSTTAFDCSLPSSVLPRRQLLLSRDRHPVRCLESVISFCVEAESCSVGGNGRNVKAYRAMICVRGVVGERMTMAASITLHYGYRHQNINNHVMM